MLSACSFLYRCHHVAFPTQVLSGSVAQDEKCSQTYPSTESTRQVSQRHRLTHFSINILYYIYVHNIHGIDVKIFTSINTEFKVHSYCTLRSRAHTHPHTQPAFISSLAAHVGTAAQSQIAAINNPPVTELARPSSHLPPPLNTAALYRRPCAVQGCNTPHPKFLLRHWLAAPCRFLGRT